MNLITSENYHVEVSRVSKSGLDKIDNSPAAYYHQYLDRSAIALRDTSQTKEQFLGEFFHCCLLEPHMVMKRYQVLPIKIDKRTKVGKALWHKWQIAGKGKQLVNRDVYNMALSMVNSINAHPIARKLFSSGIAEQIFTFTEPITGVPCKIKVDWLHTKNIIVDLKSAVDALCDLSHELNHYDEYGRIIPEEIGGIPVTKNIYKGFPKAVFAHRYDVQDVFYSDGYNIATGNNVDQFIFVAVEKTEPYTVQLYCLSEDIRIAARQKYIRNLKTYKLCSEQNYWPGHSQKIIQIN